MSTDAIVLLREEHKEIKRLFREFEQAKGSTAGKRQRLVQQIVKLLGEHTYVENQVLYPRVRQLLPRLEDDLLEAYEQHHVADRIVEELVRVHPDDKRFNAKTSVLIETVRRHIDEEESKWFPRVREGLGRKELQDLGAEMQRVRKDAPDPPGPGLLQRVVDSIFT